MNVQFAGLEINEQWTRRGETQFGDIDRQRGDACRTGQTSERKSFFSLIVFAHQISTKLERGRRATRGFSLRQEDLQKLG